MTELSDRIRHIALVHSVSTLDELEQRRAAKQERAVSEVLYPRGERVDNVTPIRNEAPAPCPRPGA